LVGRRGNLILFMMVGCGEVEMLSWKKVEIAMASAMDAFSRVIINYWLSCLSDSD